MVKREPSMNCYGYTAQPLRKIIYSTKIRKIDLPEDPTWESPLISIASVGNEIIISKRYLHPKMFTAALIHNSLRPGYNLWNILSLDKWMHMRL